MLRKIKLARSTSRPVNYIILPVLSATLLVLAFPRFDLEFLAWVSFVPLFIALEKKTLKQKFFIGYLFGIVFFSSILYWLLNVTIPGTIVLVLLLSFVPAIFSILYRFISLPVRQTGGIAPYLSVIAVPAAWIITEYLRAHLFTGFPWALLGYSQYLNQPIIQICDITGAYGVSFIIIMVNFCIYTVLRRLPHGKIYTILTLILLIGTFFYGHFRLKQNYVDIPLTVSVIQGNIPQEIKWNERYRESIFDKYSFLTLMASEAEPDIIIWPETAIPDIMEKKSYVFNKISMLAKKTNTYLLTGVVREENSFFYNSAVLISDKGKMIEHYDKIHLVPFGEYIPLEKYFPWLRDKVDKPIGDFDSSTRYSLFRIKSEISSVTDIKIVKDLRFYKFAVLICFEDMFPDLVRQFVKKGALFLVNITNDAWFGKTSAPFQHVQSSVFRAVENRVPVVRAANTGVSCFINQKGRIVGSVEKGRRKIFVEGYKQTKIYPFQMNTLYTRFGDAFVYSCFFVYILNVIIIKKQKQAA